jgi:hypothetical protein
MNGLDFVQSGLFKGVQVSKSSALDSQIPPIFKAFLENFCWNELAKSNPVFFLPYLEGGEVQLSNHHLLNSFDNSAENDPWMNENGFHSFASSNRGVYVGTKDGFEDQIFSTKSSMEGDIILIANNIFEFTRGLTDNLSECANSSEEFRVFMEKIGFEGEDLTSEVESWENWNRKRHIT